jgi:flagellar biosynthesis/type III secretory pathway M-ring protein FliF/YscJ
MNQKMIFDLVGMGSALLVLCLVTVVFVFIISQVFKNRRAKIATAAEIAQNEAYRNLAEEAITVQRKTAEDQQKITKDISEMKARINSIEKMLREVQ